MEALSLFIIQMEQKAKETEAVFYEKSVEKDLRRTCSVFFTFNLATFGMGRKSHYFENE